jgi:3-dehydroquinate dehydratase-2
MKILILNGPNLNLLGTRQPEVYGKTTLPEIRETCIAKAISMGIEIEFLQTNYEGQLVDWIQSAKGVYDGIIINAGAYTHTSVAIMDAVNAVEVPTLELHLSNIYEREEFRHTSYIGMAAFDSIMGHGANGYPMAMTKMVEHLS